MVRMNGKLADTRTESIIRPSTSTADPSRFVGGALSKEGHHPTAGSQLIRTDPDVGSVSDREGSDVLTTSAACSGWAFGPHVEIHKDVGRTYLTIYRFIFPRDAVSRELI